MLLDLLIDWRTWGTVFATFLTSVSTSKAFIQPGMTCKYPHHVEHCRHHW